MLRVRARSDGIYMALGSKHIPNTLEYAIQRFSYTIPRVYLQRNGN